MKTPRRDLFLLWFGQLVSQAGDAVTGMATMWLALEMTGSKTTAGLVAFAHTVPVLLFSLAAGVAVDRLNRRRLLLISDAARMVLVCLIPILYQAGYLSPWVLGAIVFTMASFGSLFNPARDTLVPLLVQPAKYLRVNALMQSSGYLAFFVGLFGAGGLLGLISITTLFWFDAATFGVSFLAIWLMKIPERTDDSLESKPGKSVMDDIREGLRYVWREDPRLLWLVIITAVNNLFVMGPAFVGIPILVREVLGGGGREYAWIESTYGIGMLLGTFLVYRVARFERKGTLLMLGLIFDGLTYCPLYWVDRLGVPAFYSAVGIIFIHSLGIPFIQVMRTSLIHSVVPAHLQGRVFSMIHFGVMGMTSISVALTGIMAEYFDSRLIFLLIGLGAGACGMVGLARRDLREAD